MSTFDGVVKEYPLISIDNFLETSQNFQSTVFFLSHCHSDHMKGLRDKKFFELLESRGFSRLYMSDVSEHLLKNDEWFSHLSKYLVSLPIEQPTIIDVYDEYGDICSRVVVTLLTAGHCPGSVMFLLEGESGRVLYTGDFRLPVGASARLPNLHDENGRLKTLDSLYIDTTFCSKACMYIPTREECLLEILKLVEAWLSKGPNYIVRFICPAQYNYEFVFVEIFKKLGEKTHVFEEKLKKYKGIKVIEDAVTSIPSEARVHACVSGFSNDFREILYAYETPCGYHTEDLKPIKVRLIKPSAMFFKHKNYTEISAFDYGSKVHRVCFSAHSSLDEIRDMVKYLEPKRVYPNVVRNQTVEQILHLIGASVRKTSPDSLLPLGQLNNDLANDDSTIASTNSFPFYDDCYEIPHQRQLSEKAPFVQDSPTRPKVESTNPIILQSGQTEKAQQSEVFDPSNVERNSTALGKSNCDISSPVKWECPILSSDDENSDTNTSFSCSKDKSDSEVCATSEEQNSTQLENECLTPAESKQLQSELPAISDDSVQDHSQRKCSSGIRFELEKLLASQEPIVDGVVNSKSQAGTSTNFEGSFLKADLNVNASANSGELIHKPSYTNPEMKLVSEMHCNNRDIPTASKELLTKTNDLSKPSFSKQENSGKSEIVAHCRGSFLKADLNVNSKTNSRELIHKPSYTNSEIKLDSEMHCNNIDIRTTSKELLTKTNDLSKPSFSKQANSGKSEIVAHAIEFVHKSNDQVQNRTTWRGSKLMLEVNKEASASTSKVETVSPRLTSDKSIDINNQRANSLITSNLCTKNIVTNTNLNSNVAIKQGQSSIRNISNKLNHTSQSFLNLPQFLDNTHLTRTVSKSDRVVSSKTSKSVAQRVIGKTKPKRTTKKRKSIASKYKFCDYQSEHAFGIIGIPNRIGTSEFASRLPCFSKKLKDPFASKYEKSLGKFQKKSPVTKDSDTDILILPNINKCDKPIQMIDLSSDESIDYKSDVELFGCKYRDSELMFPSGNVKTSQKEQTSEISEIEDDSPSLLIPTKKNIKLETGLIAHSIHLDTGRKRKSAAEIDFVRKKSPKHEVAANSHPICGNDSNIDSTPEDLLPFTHTQVSSYLKKILR